MAGGGGQGPGPSSVYLSIQTHLLQLIKQNICQEVFLFKSPTPGIGEFIIIDPLSDISPQNKDATITQGGRYRFQIKVYSDDSEMARNLLIQTRQYLRGISNSYINEPLADIPGNSFIEFIQEAGSFAGYGPIENRFYYILEIFVYYKYLPANILNV
jgi:hypothetical protein